MSEKSKINEPANYKEKEEAVIQRSRDFIGLLAKRGFLEDTGIEDEKIRKVVKEKNRVMYHNTKPMLER